MQALRIFTKIFTYAPLKKYPRIKLVVKSASLVAQ